MEITTEKLKQKIENGEKLVVDFYGIWCSPCKIMKPTFEKLSDKYREENSEVQLYTMDVDKNRDLAVEYGVRAIPTIKVFNNGNVVDSKTGVQSETQLTELVQSLLN
jgi:thioredoxin 1